MREGPVLKPVMWMGDSRETLRGFPDKVQDDIGHSLMVVQAGLMPSDAKPLKGIGGGVFEIATRYDGNAYRAVYAVKLAERVYVLHVFQKKSKTGIKTPRREIDLIINRLREAKQRAGKQ
jgi:phage-related protein